MSGPLWTALAVFHVVVFAYFILLNGYYLVTSIFSFRVLRNYAQQLTAKEADDEVTAAGGPPVTLVVPTYNEESSCLESVPSFLSLQYADYEVVIVNDGSTDHTLETLVDAYDLVPASRFPTADIETAPVREVYRSERHPDLWVVDKENGGRADAINAGINFCRTPLFCVTDADSIIESGALSRIVRPFMEDERTVASGGIVRIANGSVVEDGVVQDVRLPRKLVPRFQVLEYLRAFLAGRVGWNALGIMFLISGAFGLFKRSLVVEMGGLASDSLGEDMELTVRLHRYCRDNDIPYRVTFVPDPVVWTEAPESLRVLGRQRDRWQRGLIDTLWRHKEMLGNPRYGRIGTIAYPYFFFLEMMGPVVEFVGYIVFAVLLALGVVSLPFVLLFVLLAFVLGSVLSVVAVALEELSFRRYVRFRDLLRMFWLALIENFGYRQVLTYYRVKGIISYLRGNTEWGEMERTGFTEAVR